jgi:hypothetical protein
MSVKPAASQTRAPGGGVIIVPIEMMTQQGNIRLSQWKKII